MARIESELVCSRCNSRDFMEGPHGGSTVMVKCAKCGYRMNVTPIPGGRFWITEEKAEE